MGVFARTRVPSDSLPAYALARANALTVGQDNAAPDAQIGTLFTSQSRRLLANQGSNHVDVYAFPNSKGQVCVVYSAIYGSDGCFGAFTSDVPVSFAVTDPDEVGSGYPAVVAGLAPDTVESISVVIDGSEHQATLQNGAYFYQLGSTESWPQGVVVHYRNGSTASVGVPAIPTIKNPDVG
ncbi:MAG TPA: hypothetical protein VF094_12395 [Gaiellaceae bacterium]